MKINWNADKRNSIGSSTGRLSVEGTRAVEVRPSATSKQQIAALLDLLDLHLSNAQVAQPVHPREVTLRVPVPSSEARGAIGTLVDALVAPVQVNVLEQAVNGDWSLAATGWDASNVEEYPGWPALLQRPRPVPDLVSRVVRATSLSSLRAYPMLSTSAGWSLRLEGLEIGRTDGKRVRLKVGKDGKLGDRSLQRRTWIESTGHSEPFQTGDVEVAAKAIASFAKSWQALGQTRADHDEHALESRILRGATPIDVGGKPLSLIQQDDGVVNWGSQFPTKWGPGGKARYLDALLRDGSTPWAVEMKVQGGAGVGQYYRHAVAQAVLYREFIRRAFVLHPWFEMRGLDATRCQGAVVVPRLTNPRHAHWRARVTDLCAAFEVTFVEVDPSHALRH
ncbi:unannotated protein [freshwater metagenome]|uniref:Unannotated protein n=1 Tax=freshwater metagenome TaxID=449393 RepID=A0A6J7HY43_9ZZZZ|nr:hypothetical protein [Actinomycetota bacterium]